jgi:hypothetical protein
MTLLTAPAAHAVEREWRAGLDAGFASLFGDNSAAGFGGGVHGVYGLSDAFNALLEVDYTRQPSAHSNVWSAAAGVAYTFDVAQLVPYAGLLVGGYKLSGDLATTAPGMQLALGLDYRIDRHWAAGLQVRMHTIFGDGSPIGATAYGTTFARFEYVFGF